MCGFAGFYNLSQRWSTIDEHLLDRMQKKIMHRGPDAMGIWKSDKYHLGLTSRRLKIIDLSEDGNQPMHSENNQVVLCYNGEIYNYKTVSKELEGLGFYQKTQSDTETIINAYKAWGIKGFERLEGMFACALFDFQQEKLYLIRDRIGVKPLYFSMQGGVLSFASEIKALWELPWIERMMNIRAWYHYLTFMVAPAPLTMFEGIYKLPAGFYAEVDKHKRISFHEWYTPITSISPLEKKEFSSEDFCIKSIQEMLFASAQKRMVSDVPVGAYLSGGLDSSLNVALMSRFSSNIKTFTVAFTDDKNHELEWARRVAREFGTEHHEYIISEKDAFDFYERMVKQLDEPLADCVCIPFYYVSALAHEKGMKVVQVGEGADELFFGYDSYAKHLQLSQLLNAMPKSIIPAFAKKILALGSYPFVHDRPLRMAYMSNWAEARELFWGGAIAFSEHEKRSVRNFFGTKPVEPDYILGQIYPGLDQQLDSHTFVRYHLNILKQRLPQADGATQILYLELKQRLPELLLMRADKMAMATSIEAREPYLDHKLVEFMMHVPLHMRLKKGTTKYLLKKAAEGILPHEIIYRKKVGFAAPTFSWFERGKYFPAYFERLSLSAKNYPVCAGAEGMAVVNASMNRNLMHRAVQNWVLQQLWAFTGVR